MKRSKRFSSMLNKENTNTANFGHSRPKSGYNLRAFGRDTANMKPAKGKSQSNVRTAS